jgi:hypothetical protein
MEEDPIQIGYCKGCDRFLKLNSGVCDDCLTGPHRGREWANMMHKCRCNSKYAKVIYNSIKTDRGRRLFVLMFGIPSHIQDCSMFQFIRKS